MTEIFKVINNIVPSRICSLFETFENIHNASYFQILSSFRPLFSFTYNCNYGKYSRYFLQNHILNSGNIYIKNDTYIYLT